MKYHFSLKAFFALSVLFSLQVACGEDPSFFQKENDKKVHKQDQSNEVDTKSIDDVIIDGDIDPNTEDEDLGEAVQDFIQHDVGQVDILWVIDNSGSMQPFQDSLRHNFSAFINELSAKKVNFSIGVTSTDICPSRQPQNLEDRVCPGETSNRALRGQLVGENGRKVLRADDEDLISRFQDYANLGTSGSSFEHGLSAVRLAVQRSLDGGNEGFVRDDAFLSVIVVSDEEDDGVGLSRTNEEGINYWDQGQTRYQFSAENLKNYLSTIKGDRFSVSSIVGTRDGTGQLCDKATEEGQEYIRATKMTSGYQGSICVDNWSETLSKLGEDLNSQIESVTLEHIPVLGTLMVEVNDQPYGYWFYNNLKNTVQFRPGYVPEAGSFVRISYKYRQE